MYSRKVSLPRVASRWHNVQSSKRRPSATVFLLEQEFISVSFVPHNLNYQLGISTINHKTIQIFADKTQGFTLSHSCPGHFLNGLLQCAQDVAALEENIWKLQLMQNAAAEAVSYLSF